MYRRRRGWLLLLLLLLGKGVILLLLLLLLHVPQEFRLQAQQGVQGQRGQAGRQRGQVDGQHLLLLMRGPQRRRLRGEVLQRRPEAVEGLPELHVSVLQQRAQVCALGAGRHAPVLGRASGSPLAILVIIPEDVAT